MLSLFQCNSNDPLDEIIRFEDVELSEIVTIMVEIACCEIYTFYLEENQVVINNQIVKMTGAKKKIYDTIYERIFLINDKTKTAFQTIIPTDFVKRFNQDNLVRINSIL
jgi:hypothetical protein